MSEQAMPFGAFERMVAWRYLRPRRREAAVSVVTIISLIGIIIGVATLIIVMAVMNGFRTELVNKIIGLNGHIYVQPVDGPLTSYDAIAERIKGVAGVTHAIPIVEGQTLASGNIGAGIGALVRGLSETSIKSQTLINEGVERGTLDGFDEAEGIAIGYRMATNLGLSLGDNLTLISPEGDVTPFGTTPRVKAYPVVAIFNTGFTEFDAHVVFMPLNEAQLYFNLEGTAHLIEVFVEDPESVDDMRQLVEFAAARQVFLSNWKQRNRALVEALALERNSMFIILTLIVLVAALNIIASLIMLVKEKGQGIAILRTVGAKRSSILRIFIMAGMSVGVLGTVIGVILGVLFCVNIQKIQQTLAPGAWDPSVRQLAEIPALMDTGETLSVIGMALLLSFLATLIPAWRAAQLDPVEALRYE